MRWPGLCLELSRTSSGSVQCAEYQAARTEQEINEARITELEDKLARSEVIDVSKLSGDMIKFGATVTLVEEDIGQKKVWQIVGEPEADAHNGKISVTSPIARALIGKTKGDTISDLPIPARCRPCGSRRPSAASLP